MSLITIGRDPDESVCKVCLSVFCTLHIKEGRNKGTGKKAKIILMLL